MFFFLSKTLNYLIMPLSVVFIMLLVAGLVRSARLRQRFFWGSIILLFVFSNEFLANELMKAWELDAIPYRDMRQYKVGVVLTGTLIAGLEPDDRVYFGRGADRVVHTVQLFKLRLIDRILISGGSGRLVDIQEREADRFREVMIMLGVPDSAIVVENESRNTHESARAVSRILTARGFAPEDCLLITSAFHMRRSLACFRKAGWPLDYFSTDFYGHQGTYYPDAFLIPKLNALVIWQKLVKEWVGLVAYRLAGYV